MCEIRDGRHYHILDLIDKYLEYMEIVKNYSPFTLRNYKSCLYAFLGVLRGKDIKLIDNSDIDNFRLQLKEKGLGFNSIQFHLIVLRQFLKFCFIHDFPTYKYYKIETCKQIRKEPEYLDRGDLEKILNVKDRDVFKSLRNTAIIRTLYSTGCRVSELQSLNREDIINDSVRVLGKGRKYRIVFISPQARESLNRYLELREDKEKALFAGCCGKRLGVTMIEVVVRKYAKLAGIEKRVYPHALRHTFATELLKSGAPLPAIQQLLGHSSITTTQIYTHITDPYLQEVHQNFHR